MDKLIFFALAVTAFVCIVFVSSYVAVRLSAAFQQWFDPVAVHMEKQRRKPQTRTVRRRGWAADVPIAGMPATPDFDIPVGTQLDLDGDPLHDDVVLRAAVARLAGAEEQLTRLRRAEARGLLDNEPFFDLLEESRAAGIPVGATMQEAVPDHPDNLSPHENRQHRYIRLKDSNKREPNGH